MVNPFRDSGEKCSFVAWPAAAENLGMRTEKAQTAPKEHIMQNTRQHRRLDAGSVIRIHALELTIASGVLWATDDEGRDIVLSAGDRLSGGALLIEALQPASLYWRSSAPCGRLHRATASVRRWTRAVFGRREVVVR
ncbi:hypothetical protein R0381_001824 [Jeongeupia wiesaeckerbachi]|uniref:hypothetical protein n=1 Tax=Jeongeupia wiesaeckerbachi TaxID=3051218 RepID=UPI003D8035E9